MRSRFFLLGITSVFVIFSPWVAARDIADEVTDVEEITADSEAAKRLAAEKMKRVREQQIENERELKNARETRVAAEGKKREAVSVLKRAEAELQRLAAEKNQLELDTVKASQETEAAERDMADTREKIEKAKAEVTALRARLEETAKQKNEILRQAAALDDEKAIQERDLEKLVADEKKALDELEKFKTAEVAKRQAAEARVAALKAKFKQLRDQRRSTYNDVLKTRAASQRLDEQARVGAAEIQRQMQSQPSSGEEEP